MKEYSLLSGGEEVATTEAQSVEDAERNFSNMVWAFGLTEVEVKAKS